MADADTEARIRQGLARYAESMEVDRPPLHDVLDGPDRGKPAPDAKTTRPQRFLLVAACAALLIGGAAVAVWPDGESKQVATGPEREPAALRCDSRSSTDDDSSSDREGDVDESGAVVGSGELLDGRDWEARVSGWPPVLALTVVVDGQPAVGATWDEPEWSAAVEDGQLTWDLGVFGGGQFVVGIAPAGAERVEVHTSAGQVIGLCPVPVPGFGGVEFVADQVPVDEGTVEFVVLDGHARRIARGTVTVPADATPPGQRRQEAIESRGRARLPFLVEVDPARVDLPLGGGEGSDDGGAQSVAAGDAPGGQWALEARPVDGDAREVLVRMRAPELSSIDRLRLSSEGPGDLAWHVGRSIDGRYVLEGTPPPEAVATLVWGVAPSDVATVVVGLADGRIVPVPTQRLAAGGSEGRAFAGTLPSGVGITSVEGRTGDDVVRLRATGVDAVHMFDVPMADGGGLDTLASLAPHTEALLAVETLD